MLNAWLLGWRPEERLGFPFPAEGEEAALEAHKQEEREKSSAGLYSMRFCCLEDILL